MSQDTPLRTLRQLVAIPYAFHEDSLFLARPMNAVLVVDLLPDEAVADAFYRAVERCVNAGNISHYHVLEAIPVEGVTGVAVGAVYRSLPAVRGEDQRGQHARWEAWSMSRAAVRKAAEKPPSE